jgi:hypothetical protein
MEEHNDFKSNRKNVPFAYTGSEEESQPHSAWLDVGVVYHYQEPTRQPLRHLP